MIRRKGDPARIATVQAAAICFHGMDGDGVQAPGAIVIREVGGLHPFAVHFANTQSGGYHEGNYCQTKEQAIARFNQRIARFDPTGDLHRSFKNPDSATEGQEAA